MSKNAENTTVSWLTLLQPIVQKYTFISGFGETLLLDAPLSAFINSLMANL